MTDRQKIDIYKNGCFLYGFLTLVCYLQVNQDYEQYEECRLILQALREVKEETENDFPTQYGDRATDYVIDYCRNKLFWTEERIYDFLQVIPTYIESLKQDFVKAEI